MPETYYVQPIKKSDSKLMKSQLSKGKLIDHIRNTRTFIREADNLHRQYKNIQSTDANSLNGKFKINRGKKIIFLKFYCCFYYLQKNHYQNKVKIG